MLAPYSDRELLQRFLETNDEAALGALVDRHGPMLLGACRRQLRDAHLAEDVMQATFLVLVRKGRTIRRQQSLAAWLCAVGQRLARQARLAQAARSRRERRVAEAARPGADDPAWDDLLATLDEEMQRLPERLRAPLLLCFLEGRTQDEAARHLGWSLSTLRRRLEQGRDLLRTRMVRRGATLGAGLIAGVLAPSAVRAALTPELRQAILATAIAGVRGGPVAGPVALLAHGALRHSLSAKVLLGLAIALTAAAVLAAALWLATPAETPPVVQTPPPATDPVPQRRDPPDGRWDGPLPKGAAVRLGTLAFRHGRASSWYRALTFTPDGKHLVSVGGGWIHRWDLATGQPLVTLGDGWRAARVDSDLLVSEDARLATICRDDLETGKEKRTYRLTFPRETVLHGKPRFFSPDGKFCGEIERGMVQMWVTADGRMALLLRPKDGQYTALVFAPDNKTLLVGDDAHTVRVFDRASGKELRSFGVANIKGIGAMALARDGKRLVTSTWGDGFLRLWNVDKGIEEHALDFPEDGGVGSLFFTADGRTVVAGVSGVKTGSRTAVRTWDAATGKPGRAWADDPTIGTTAAVSPNGKVLATMNEAGVVRLWDVATGKELLADDASPCQLEAVIFQPDGKGVLTVGTDLIVRTWDLGGKRRGPARALPPGDAPKFTAAGKLLVSDSTKDLTRLLDPVTGKLLVEAAGQRAVVSADGKRLATTARDGRVRVFDVQTGKEVQSWVPPVEKDREEAVSPTARGFAQDGQRLVLQGDIVSTWDIAAAKPRTSWGLVRFNVLDKLDKKGKAYDRLAGVVVSPDGTKIAFALARTRPPENPGVPGVQYSRIMVLETATAKLVQQSDVDDVSVRQLAFSADGQRLAAGGNWTIYVWEVGTEKATWQFQGHRGNVTALAFSPDGSRLASASEDSTALVWELAKEP
jgi:RNA polymerase sigma factor (sigma-70 family)